MEIKTFLSGKKTYIVAGLMVLISIVELISGDISLIDALSTSNVTLLLEGLGLASLRAGVDKAL